jgi:hypothetical protein
LRWRDLAVSTHLSILDLGRPQTRPPRSFLSIFRPIQRCYSSAECAHRQTPNHCRARDCLSRWRSRRGSPHHRCRFATQTTDIHNENPVLPYQTPQPSSYQNLCSAREVNFRLCKLLSKYKKFRIGRPALYHNHRSLHHQRPHSDLSPHTHRQQLQYPDPARYAKGQPRRTIHFHR